MLPQVEIGIVQSERPACLFLCAGAPLSSPTYSSQQLSKKGVFVLIQEICQRGEGACPKSHSARVLDWRLSSPLSFCSSLAISMGPTCTFSLSSHHGNLSPPGSHGTVYLVLCVPLIPDHFILEINTHQVGSDE